LRLRSQCQLLAKLLGEPPLDPQRCLVVNSVSRLKNSKSFTQLILRKSLHSDQQAAAVTFAARPVVDLPTYAFPPTKVEVANAEVGPLRQIERLSKGRK
jgi:hypothetical protein